MPELYTTDLNKYSGVRDEITQLVGTMKTTATNDKGTEDTRAQKLQGENGAKRDKLKADAEQALVDLTATQNGLVSAAKTILDTKTGVKETKTQEWTAAKSNCNQATATWTSAVELQTQELQQGKETEQASKTGADKAFTENNQLALSKKVTVLFSHIMLCTRCSVLRILSASLPLASVKHPFTNYFLLSSPAVAAFSTHSAALPALTAVCL